MKKIEKRVKEKKKKKIGEKKVLSPNSEPAEPGFGLFLSPNSEPILRIRVRPGSFSELRTCQTRVRPVPFSEIRTCRTRVQSCFFSESEPAKPGFGPFLSPNSEPAKPGLGQILSPNSEPELRTPSKNTILDQTGYVRTISCLPGLHQYYAVDKMFWSMPQSKKRLR